MRVVTRSRPASTSSTRVQSVDRAVLLLQAVAAADGEEGTVARLAEACGLNRATAWRILRTLEAHGMVSSSRETGRWSIGSLTVDLARAAGHESLVVEVRPVLERLSAETGETAALAVARLDGLVYVDEVVPPAIVAATWLGQTVPLHATSTGKVLLAYADPSVVPRVPARGLERFTDTTVTSIPELDEELDRVRARGYATCRGEYEESAWGVSAPLVDARGLLLGVLSIWGPGSRVTDRRLDELGPVVRDAAAGLLGIEGAG